MSLEDAHDDLVCGRSKQLYRPWKNIKVTGLFEADLNIEHIRPVLEHKTDVLGERNIDLKIEIIEVKDWKKG